MYICVTVPFYGNALYCIGVSRFSFLNLQVVQNLLTGNVRRLTLLVCSAIMRTTGELSPMRTNND